MKIFIKKLSKKQTHFLIGMSIPIILIVILFIFSGDEPPPVSHQEKHIQHSSIPGAEEDIITLSPRARKLAQVEVTPVIRKFVQSKIRLYGKIDYNETNLAHITAWVPGRIEKLFINFTGMEVQTGDPMLDYYSPELIVAQEELLQSLQAYRELENAQTNFLKEQSKKNLDSARTKLHLLGIDDQQIQKIETGVDVKKILPVFAPDSGVVIHKNALEGEYVKEGTEIFTIANLDELWIQLEAYESDLMWLKLGQDVHFTTDAHPGKVFQGTISFIDPFLNEKTRTASVRVNVDNKEGQLKPGMYVTATIRSYITADEQIYIEKPIGKEPPLIIPTTAPLITGKRAIIYIQKPENEGEYQLREIFLGPKAGDSILLAEGSKKGN
ncbi:MAG: efflux RND transporter periplasmic adaptor subunit [Waddliaceae bacterium]